MFIALVYLLIHKNKWRSAALNAFNLNKKNYGND